MQRWFKKTFRILNWLPGYSREKFWGDLKAGLTTGSMLIAQGMAYAVIVGMPPIYGLYAGVIPLLVYPIFGTSHHLSVGPVAVDMLIVSAGVSMLAASNTSEYITLVILLTMMTGLLELLMGVFRLGALFNFFSRPVIAGFTMAAPIIIGFTQLKNLFGIQLPDSQHVVIIANDVLHNLNHIHLPTFYWGLATIVFLGLFKYFAPKLPSAVIVLVTSICIAWATGIQYTDIEIVGAIPHGLPGFSLPKIDFGNMRRLLPTALTLALVEFMSVASLGKAFAKRHNYLIDSNHELVAIGASNFVGGLFSTLPVSGSFSRSAAAEQAHVKTPFANVVTAGLIFLTLLLLTGFFYYLPMPVLAGIIIVAVSGLIDIEEINYIFTTKKSDGAIAIFTFLCTLFIGIQEGILLGIAASMLTLLYKYSRPAVAELGLMPNTRIFKNIERKQEAQRIDSILILRIDASFSFINADFFRDFILEKSNRQNDSTKFVIIDGSSINMLDTTATDSLQSIIKTLDNWDMGLYITGLKGPVRDVINKSGLKNFLGDDHYCETIHDAVEKILKKMDVADQGSRLEKYNHMSD